MLEDHRGPSLEIVWSQIKGRFSHRKHLKRLAGEFPHRTAVRIENWNLPPDWRQAVSEFDATGFRWRAANEGGHGVMLYCRVCRRACLIHFYDAPKNNPQLATALKILDSFQDHYTSDGHLWSVFDVRATLPVPFKLERYRLDAGRFELVFGYRQNRIILHRWALAEIVLKDKGLSGFGSENGLIGPEAATKTAVAEFSAIEERREAIGADAWLRLLTARPCYYWCRLWHVKARNRILGIVAETRRPMDSELYERICRHYETD